MQIPSVFPDLARSVYFAGVPIRMYVRVHALRKVDEISSCIVLQCYPASIYSRDTGENSVEHMFQGAERISDKTVLFRDSKVNSEVARFPRN